MQDPASSPDRRDSIGRRVGRNWWREFIMDTLTCARLDWERRLEAVAIGYATEEREFKAQHPIPNLKDLLISNAGITRMV